MMCKLYLNKTLWLKNKGIVEEKKEPVKLNSVHSTTCLLIFTIKLLIAFISEKYWKYFFSARKRLKQYKLHKSNKACWETVLKKPLTNMCSIGAKCMLGREHKVNTLQQGYGCGTSNKNSNKKYSTTYKFLMPPPLIGTGKA